MTKKKQEKELIPSKFDSYQRLNHNLCSKCRKRDSCPLVPKTETTCYAYDQGDPYQDPNESYYKMLEEKYEKRIS